MSRTDPVAYAGVPVNCNSTHYGDVPSFAAFEIDRDMAEKIVRATRMLADISASHIEFNDSRTQWTESGDPEDFSITAQYLVVTDVDFFFTGTVKHTDWAIETEGCRIADLAALFDIPFPAPASPVTLTLNVTDDDGHVIDATTTTLTLDQIGDIVDHASQAILLRRQGKAFGSTLAELDEALVAGGVIPIE